MDVVGKFDVPQPGAGRGEDLTERHRDHFQLGFEPGRVGCGQRVKQMILMAIVARRRSQIRPTHQRHGRRLPGVLAGSHLPWAVPLCVTHKRAGNGSLAAICTYCCYSLSKPLKFA
jgi:hypothetical protein